MPFLASEGCFWLPTASMTLEVKNNYAYVIMQDICNKFIEVNFCVGCMVSEPNRLLQHSTTMSLINKIAVGLVKVLNTCLCSTLETSLHMVTQCTHSYLELTLTLEKP